MVPLKQLKLTLKFATILLVLAQQTGVARSIECYRDMRLVSPFYQQYTYDGESCSDRKGFVCAYLYINASTYLLRDTPAIRKGMPLSYIFQACTQNDFCDSYCRVGVHRKFPNKIVGCFRRCCNDTNYCNTGETFSGCSGDKPCLNYGECKHVQKSTYCQCPPGFYGSRCEKKTTNRTVCSEQHKSERFFNGTLIKSEKPLSMKLCENDEKCSYRSYSYEVISNISGTVYYSNFSLLSGVGCIYAPWCSDLCATIQRQESSNPGVVEVRMKACNATCCDGDFCNIKSASGNECASNPCLNRGTCTQQVNGYSCTCVPGYTGQKCESLESMIVNTKVTNITVKRTEDIKLNCSLEGDGVTWKYGNGSEIIISDRIKINNKVLMISNASLRDAGVYVCSKPTPQGRVSYQVNLRVNVTIKVFMALHILNRNFTIELQNKTTPEYKFFVKDFKEQMNIVFKDVDGYVGIEILEIFNGSVRVRFRVVVVVVVKDNKDGSTVTRKRVIVTQRVVNQARTGWVEDLKVDKDPRSMELQKSPPPAPDNVTLVESFKDGAEIAWDLPLFHEYYYIKGYFIEYWKFSSEKKEKSPTIKGQRIKVLDLETNSPYTAWLVAENENGIRGEESKKIEIRTKKGSSIPDWLLAIIIIACIIILIVVIACIICYCRRKNSSNNKRMDDLNMAAIQNGKDAENVYPKSYVNTVFSVNEKCPNFARENLVLMDELGSGEFGVVFKGQLLQEGETKECAVKTLKGTANPEDYRELHQELEIMANVGYHPNLVNLIGSCVEDEKLFVIVEFARNGSLLDFLRKARTQPEEKLEFELNYVNRLKIALDVAKGMSHLAQKRCVHRDLAARNILLADDFVAKVADFGLSRDIYETGEYEKTTTGKLPTRWMAIESLELRRFTMKSDVWSFGVLLWELETKGLMPHGAISFTELLDKQKKGHRLEQPKGTPDELYRVLQMCWQANPQQRPTFSQICNTLEVMLNDNQTSNGNLNKEDLEIKQGPKNQGENTNNQTFA